MTWLEAFGAVCWQPTVSYGGLGLNIWGCMLATYRSYGANLRHLGLYVGNLQVLEATMLVFKLQVWGCTCLMATLGLYVGNLQSFGGNNVGFNLQVLWGNLRHLGCMLATYST